MDTFFLPWFGIDLKKGKASIVGDGTQPVSFTHRHDVARLLTQLILDDDDVKEKEVIVRLGSLTKPLNDVFSLYEALKKCKVDVTKESVVEVKERMKQVGTDVWSKAIDSLRMAIAEGGGWNRPPLYTGNLKDFISLSYYFSNLS